jgi:hypothetical protein
MKKRLTTLLNKCVQQSLERIALGKPKSTTQTDNARLVALKSSLFISDTLFQKTFTGTQNEKQKKMAC